MALLPVFLFPFSDYILLFARITCYNASIPLIFMQDIGEFPHFWESRTGP